MTDNGATSETYELTRVPLGDWSRTEYLYIQLYSELLFAVAHLSAAACPSIDDCSQYISYCQYFATDNAATDESLEEAGSGVVKGIDAFIEKRDELSGAIMWALRKIRMREIKNSNAKGFSDVDVSPALLKQYRQIRERLGLDTKVDNPKLCSALWSFLQDAARKQFPEFSGDATQAEPTQDTDTNGNVDVDMDSTPVVGPVPANDLANTSDHESSNEDNMSAADDDTNSGAARQQARTGVAVGTAERRPGPDDFARETGPIICTRYMENGARCKRQALAIGQVDRRVWLCHNHDPVQKQITAAKRAARNAAAKKAKR